MRVEVYDTDNSGLCEVSWAKRKREEVSAIVLKDNQILKLTGVFVVGEFVHNGHHKVACLIA